MRICLLLSFILSFNMSLSQIHEPPKGGLAKEDYMLMLIDSLEFAESRKDSLNVIRYASVLTTAMHGSKIRERSKYYLNIALSYAAAFSNRRWYPEVCNRVGMYYFASRNFADPGSELYKAKNDSSIFWHKKAIELGKKISNPITQGWGHRGVMSVYIDMHVRNMGDFSKEINYHFREIDTIADTHDNTELFIHASQRFCTYLSYEKKVDEVSLLLERLVPLSEKMNVAQSLAFLNTLHDFIAVQNELDTLVVLNQKLFIKFDQNIAASHKSKLHEADQKYEVTKTRGKLEDTQEELELSKLRMLYAGIGALVILMAMLYFYRLNEKNKKLSQRNELLLKEQNHRVKNNLQMINSLLSLQSQKLLSSDAKAALNESQNRINSVALLHRMLYEGEDLGVINTKQYLDNLIEEISYTANRKIAWEIKIDPSIHVSVEKATSLGLIVNELITNSIKHVEESVSLVLQLEINQVHGEVELYYRDNGKAFDAEVWKTSDSFGNQLIRLQSEQLRGKYEIVSKGGFRYTLKLSA